MNAPESSAPAENETPENETPEAEAKGKKNAPAFDRKVAKQVFPVRHKKSQRTINYTMPTKEGGAFHCFTGRGEFIATLKELPKE